MSALYWSSSVAQRNRLWLWLCWEATGWLCLPCILNASNKVPLRTVIIHSGFKYRETERCFNEEKCLSFWERCPHSFKGVSSMRPVGSDNYYMFCFFCFFPFKCSNLEIVIKADLPDPLMAASVAAVFAYTFKNTFQRFNSIRADDFLLMVQSIMSIVCSKSFPNNLQISRFSHFSNKETSTACQLQLVKRKDWQLFFICHLCILQLVVGQRE